MATRAATFTAKIRNLKDYHSRIINSGLPLPNGTDVANTLKYFSQTLIGVLKDVPASTKELFVRRQTDRDCLQVFPDLDYLHLYETVVSIVDAVPLISTGQHALGESLLGVIGCLAPFLSSQILDTLPCLVASTLTSFPTSLHRDILMLLCTNLLPITLSAQLNFQGHPTYATDSIPSMLMIIFQFAISKEYHSMIVECLMSLKRDVFSDLMCIVAYGTSAARGPAVNLLFYFWPQLTPIHFDRTGLHGTFIGFEFAARGTILCQKSKCLNNRCVAAVKSCLDPRLVHDTTVLPIHMCQSCVDELPREVVEQFKHVVRRIERMELYCENEDCNAKNVDQKKAISTCFSAPCILFNDQRPMRLCEECHLSRHEPGSHHIFHLTPPSLWSADHNLRVLMVDSIVSLLKEAENLEDKRLLEMGDERGKLHSDEDSEADGKKLLSRYGVWMLVQLVPVKADISFEILGHLLSALFHWFDATTYLKDNVVGNALDRLKSKYLCPWMMEILDIHGDIITACLLPHPIECFKVASCYDALSSRTLQIKEGLNQLLCLIPFNIITTECWNYIMPFWLESIGSEVPEHHLGEFKILLRKLFDGGMGASPFKSEDVFQFAHIRFVSSNHDVQLQTLSWLQILTDLQVFISIEILVNMFMLGTNSLQKSAPMKHVADKPATTPKIDDNDDKEEEEDEKDEDREKDVLVEEVNSPPAENEDVLKCYLIMLDILLKQIEIQDVEPHRGVDNTLNQTLLEMLSSMITTLLSKTNLIGSNIQISLHQLCNKLITFIVSKNSKMTTEQGPVNIVDQKLIENGNTDFNLAALPPQHQLLFHFSELIRVVSNVICKYLCLTSMYLLCQHSDFLRTQNNLQERKFFKHFLSDLALPGLWNMLSSEHNQAGSSAVSLLIYFITFPFSSDVFGNIIEKKFGNNSWNVRFDATEKVAVIASCLNEDMIGTNEIVRSTLAHAFYHLIGSLDDVNSSVAVKAALLIESMSTKSLKGICLCLEHHFDRMINDRTLILNKFQKLSTVLLNSNKNHSILSWEFFFNKLDVLCLEAQIGLENLGEITHLEDLYHSDLLGDYFLEKVARARLALMRSNHCKSFKKCCVLNIGGGKPQSTFHVYSKQHAPARKDQKKSTCTRQQSTPFYRGRGSRFGAGLFTNAQVCGNLREFTNGENNLMSLLQKIVTFEELDGETMHHLVELFMIQLMLSPDAENDTEPNKPLSNLLWHLSLLLGYNVTEKIFSVPPYKMRSSVVFNAYISGLAKVLDRNFKLGTTILPFALDILQYCPSPQRYASDYQPPNYSLWYLEPYVRISWLQSLLVILYKYSYTNSEVIVRLIKITINTIDARFHQCRRKEETVILPSPYLQRNRDTSNVSVGDLENIMEIETPPGSPLDEDVTSPTLFSTPQMNRKTAAIFDQITGGSAVQSPASSRPSSPVLSRFVSKSSKVEDIWKRKKDETTRSEDDQARRIAEYKIPFTSEESTFSAMKMKFQQQKGDGILLKNLSHLKHEMSKPESLKDIETSSIILDASELLSKNLHGIILESVGGLMRSGDSKSFKHDDLIGDNNDDSKHGKAFESPSKRDVKGRKSRKTGLSMVQLSNEIPELNCFISEHISNTKERARRSEMLQKHSEEQELKQKQGGSCSRSMDNLLVDQCPSCSTPLECYDEETVSTAIICLATFIHREPTMAAPLLPNMFLCVSRIAANSPFLWQSEQVGVVIPGNSMSTARQFLRCVLHQLAPNNVFPQLFTSSICDTSFLSVLASTLADFPELNCHIAFQLILEGLNEMKTLQNEQLTNAIVNISNFMDHLVLDSTNAIISLFELFFRKISILIPSPFNNINSLLKIIISILKMPAVSSVKSILEPFSKVLSFTIQNCSFRLQLLMDICSLCGRAFTKERDKFYLSRCVVTELVQTIRFKQVLPDENFVLLVQMMCLDAGGTLGPINIVKELASYTFNPHSQTLVSTNVAECLKMHLSDCIEFIADIHTTNKLKTNTKGAFQNLNEDTLGSHLKVGIAQFVALEFSYSTGKDGRLVARYLPWLFHPPAAILTGPREFVDCICHVRILCWLLLGSLMHSAVTGAAGAMVCRPLTMDCCGYIADHIMVILTGFTGQSKTSVLHMSSLFHAFMLCQLWTMYCELQDVLDMPLVDDSTAPNQTIIDFWGKVTPGILQLLSHSKVMSEMVNLHFLSLMEALQECNSTVLVKLFSLWVPILRSYHSQLPGHMQVRLQMCQNWRPTKSSKEPKSFCEMLAKWIKRIQFKLSQIEVQSSTATQFYAV